MGRAIAPIAAFCILHCVKFTVRFYGNKGWIRLDTRLRTFNSDFRTIFSHRTRPLGRPTDSRLSNGLLRGPCRRFRGVPVRGVFWAAHYRLHARVRTDVQIVVGPDAFFQVHTVFGVRARTVVFLIAAILAWRRPEKKNKCRTSFARLSCNEGSTAV